MLGTADREDLQNGDRWERLTPGFYVDSLGGEYFYLTGLYGYVVKRLLDGPGLNTPAFVVGVLEELRRQLTDRYCVELTD